MARNDIVRESVPVVPGDGADSSQREAESPSSSMTPFRLGEAHLSADSPSFFAYLTDHQLGGIAVFCVIHEHCDEVEFCPIWDWTLSEVLEVAVFCPSCAEERTYRMEGGE